MPLVAGVDCGTQSTKVVVVDADSGATIATGHAPHQVSGGEGRSECDPDEWWRALGDALDATGRAADVHAVSVAGQQHGLVLLDEQGHPVRPALLWNDTRSAGEAATLVDALGGAGWWAAEIGSVPLAAFTVSKWGWVRAHEPAHAGATRAVRLPHDFLTERLTGVAVSDRGDASGTGWWSAQAGEYSVDVLERVDLDPGLLPRVAKPDEVVGQVVEAIGGMRKAIPVGPGTGDNMGAALGLGVPPGTPVVSLGTSGTAYAVMTEPAADPTGTVAGFADATGRFLPLACTLNATLAVDRVANWLHLQRDDVAARTGVTVLPWFDGERTPNRPDATAVFSGLRHSTTPQELLLATYEGVVAGLLDALDLVAEQGSGVDPAVPIVLVGGGAKGATWRNVVLRLSGRALKVPRREDMVALGAAAQAAAVLAGEHPSAVAARWAEGADVDVYEPVDRDDEARARVSALRAATP